METIKQNSAAQDVPPTCDGVWDDEYRLVIGELRRRVKGEPVTRVSPDVVLEDSYWTVANESEVAIRKLREDPRYSRIRERISEEQSEILNAVRLEIASPTFFELRYGVTWAIGSGEGATAYFAPFGKGKIRRRRIHNQNWTRLLQRLDKYTLGPLTSQAPPGDGHSAIYYVSTCRDGKAAQYVYFNPPLLVPEKNQPAAQPEFELIKLLLELVDYDFVYR